MHKCSFKDGLVIKPDGFNELDPCIYEEVESWRNVTVIVSKCKRCGAIDISWQKQENSELIEEDEYDAEAD